MALYIYIRKHLTPITKSHLSIITGFDPKLSFSLVDGTEVIDKIFRFIRTPKPGMLIKVQLEPVLTDRRVGAFLIAGFVDRLKDVVIIPGLPMDPMLSTTERARGDTLATQPAYTMNRNANQPAIVHYDVTEEPWKYRPVQTEGMTYICKSRADSEIEITRPEVLCHELNHLEWHQRIRPMFEPPDGWSDAEVEKKSNEFAVRRTNKYRAWKHKSEDDKYMRLDHEEGSCWMRSHRYDPVTKKVTVSTGEEFDFSDVDMEVYSDSIEFDFAEEE